MGIILASNFDVKTNLPLDGRYKVDTIQDRNSIPSNIRFIGLQCYVTETNRIYTLSGGIENDNWAEMPYSKDYEDIKEGVFKGDITLFDGADNEIPSLKSYIDNIVVAANGLRYKGVLEANWTLYSCLTPAAEVGDIYLVDTSKNTTIPDQSYVNGMLVESGDMLICHTKTEAATQENKNDIRKNWNIIQANVNIMQGATDEEDGMAGLVPAPKVSISTKFLASTGKWSTVNKNNIVIGKGTYLNSWMTDVDTNIGDLSTLTTNDKTSLVNAINDLKASNEDSYTIKLQANGGVVDSNTTIKQGWSIKKITVDSNGRYSEGGKMRVILPGISSSTQIVNYANMSMDATFVNDLDVPYLLSADSIVKIVVTDTTTIPEDALSTVYVEVIPPTKS